MMDDPKKFSFATSPSIRQAIKSSGMRFGEFLGQMKVCKYDMPRKLVTEHFHPFDGDGLPGSITRTALIGVGAGTLVELAMERHLLKMFPEYLISCSETLTVNRYQQLLKRGRTFTAATLEHHPSPHAVYPYYYSVEPVAIPLAQAVEMTKIQVLGQISRHRAPETASNT